MNRPLSADEVRPSVPDLYCDNCGDLVEDRPYQITVQRFDRAATGTEVTVDLLRWCLDCGNGLRVVLRLNKATVA